MSELLAETIDTYRRMIRSAVRGYWNGSLTYSDFFDAMISNIEIGITQAWVEGAKECGIAVGELTDEEQTELRRAKNYERLWIGGFADAIEAGSKANKGKLAPLYSRAEIWIGRYEGVVSKARTMACADRKLEWVLGPTDKSCGSCQKLAGKVKRGSYWYEKGILPRVHDAPYLECKGFRCLCQLLPTDKPMSKGPLPSLP